MRKKIFFVLSVFLIAAEFFFARDTQCQSFRYDAKGRRDPFVPLLGVDRVKVSGLEDVISAEDVKLEGIAVGPGGKKTVVMNGKILKEGDKIGVVEVVKIGDKAVTLIISGTRHDINLSKEGGGAE